jgi:hypothetical protein
LLEPQLLVFVDLPEVEILQDLDPLDLTIGNRCFEQVFYKCKRLRSDRDVVRLEDDLIDVLCNRVLPVIRKRVTRYVSDDLR